MDKFGRVYRLTINPIDGSAPIIVQMPFTIRFRVTQDIGSEQNQLDIEIYNLSLAHREHIFQDRYVLGACVGYNATGATNITLEMGYGTTLYEVYSGYMFQANSAREGTNIVTHIVALGGKTEIASVQTQQTLQAPIAQTDVIKFLIGQYQFLKEGAVGSFPNTFNSPVVLNGNTYSLLKKYTDDKVCIYNGRIYALNEYEVLPNVANINDATGILGTPRRDQGLLVVTTLLEANITLGQTVNVQSSVEPKYDGTYRVNGYTHEGIISGALNGQCRSIFKLLSQNQFQQFKTLQPA